MAFVAYEISRELTRALHPLIALVRRRDKSLADQIDRALASIGLNLLEGRMRTGRDRLHLFKVAAGSAGEVTAALDQAEDRQYLRIEQTASSRSLLDRQRALLWGLTRPRI